MKYKLTIVTKYNVIHWEVDDVNSEEVKEVLSMPYVLEYNIEKLDKEKTLKRERNSENK